MHGKVRLLQITIQRNNDTLVLPRNPVVFDDVLEAGIHLIQEFYHLVGIQN